MGRIPQETIDQIRDSADIHDVVSRVVDLKKRGRNFFGLCPFHHEKTPSFSVAPEKGIYHCFGCGAGGSAINFIMEYDKITFVEAVQQLGDQLGIEVKMADGGGSKELFTQLYEIHNLASDLYHRTLFSKRGKEALAYLRERGLKEETLKQFKVGFAPDSHEFLTSNAGDKKFSRDVMEKSGLFGKSDRGFFDRFRSRIMFPIFNPSGKVIAFGGRVFGSEDPAKYMNSPETPLYHKSDIFYGLHVSRDSIRKKGAAVLVEGYTDVLQLFQAGIHEVVAVSGTAFTDRHATQIRKFTDKMYLAYDGDNAGINAALRAGYTLLKGGVDPKVIQIPDALDPDEWVKRDGPDAFQKGMDSAESVLPFHLRVKNAKNLAPAERSDLVKGILRETLDISDPIIQGDLLKTLANTLGVGDREITNLFNRQAKKKYRPAPEKPEGKEPDLFTSLTSKAELGIVRVLLTSDKKARTLVEKNLEIDQISSDLLKPLIKALIDSEDPDFSRLVEKAATGRERDLLTSIFMEEDTLSDPVQMAQECLVTLNRIPLKDQIKAARIKMRELAAVGKDTTELLLKVTELQRKLKAES